MNHLEKFEKISEDPEKLKLFKLEIDVAIDAYAEITDYLKKQHYRWNRETDELCTLRSIIQKKMKENNNG